MKYTFFGHSSQQKIIENWIYDDINPDVVFSFGGDGTMLSAIHKYESIIDNVKFIGIKSGHLGFFYSFESLNEAIEKINNNDIVTNNYNLLEYKLKLEFDEQKEIKGYALNEIAITNPIHTQVMDLLINNEFFEKFRGTGFIVSPPAGSTAYSKSMGGSIIDPSIKAFQLVEIASINNRLYKSISSPLVFSNNYHLTIIPNDINNLYISVDGREVQHKNLQSIEINLSTKEVKILNIKEDFFTKVKNSFLK